FLYPSEEDMYKLIRFLVGRLSELSTNAVSPDTKFNNVNATVNIDHLGQISNDADTEERNLHTKVEDLKLRTDEVVSSSIQCTEDVAAEKGNSETNKVGLSDMENGGGSAEDTQLSRKSAGGKGEVISQEDVEYKLEQAPISHPDKSSQASIQLLFFLQENVHSEESTARSLELQQLEEQHDLLKAAVEMASDKQTPLDSYITQLGEQIDAKRHNLAKIESKWKATIRCLEEKKHKLEEAMCAKQPDSQHKHQNWKKLEKDLVCVLSETKQREDELSILSKEVEKLPKLATRRSYIERIKEITKNSRKQDIDIERILKETRELQLESNMIQERLHRTYAVVDETLLREAKKDQVVEQAHNLLTTIHESFEEITEKILATDRARREATDLETKLSSVAAQSLNIDKLQADLDAIRKENEYLECRLSNS
ncbi:coiled-coil domain-containing protein 22 isoform X2, partial [Tanacetum coccineum]